MKHLMIWLIGLYRKFISPLKPPCCRFTPTCSAYAIEAFQKRGFFLASNFKETETGISGEFILLLGGSIYDVTRTLDEPQGETAAIKDSVQKKLDDGWDLILKVKPNYYLVKDTENNRGRIEKLFKNNIRNFDFVEYRTKQEGDITILKSIVINVHRKR